jgi:hypothetical protein
MFVCFHCLFGVSKHLPGLITFEKSKHNADQRHDERHELSFCTKSLPESHLSKQPVPCVQTNFNFMMKLNLKEKKLITLRRR